MQCMYIDLRLILRYYSYACTYVYPQMYLSIYIHTYVLYVNIHVTRNNYLDMVLVKTFCVYIHKILIGQKVLKPDK